MTEAANATSALLTKARASIAEGWTQNIYARDAQGESVSSKAESAVCWCAAGAMAKHVRGDGSQSEAYALLMLAMHCTDIAAWNDSAKRTQAEVLAAFDLAIKSCND